MRGGPDSAASIIATTCAAGSRRRDGRWISVAAPSGDLADRPTASGPHTRRFRVFIVTDTLNEVTATITIANCCRGRKRGTSWMWSCSCGSSYPATDPSGRCSNRNPASSPSESRRRRVVAMKYSLRCPTARASTIPAFFSTLRCLEVLYCERPRLSVNSFTLRSLTRSDFATRCRVRSAQRFRRPNSRRQAWASLRIFLLDNKPRLYVHTRIHAYETASPLSSVSFFCPIASFRYPQRPQQYPDG